MLSAGNVIGNGDDRVLETVGHRGVEIFDPKTGQFDHFSRDQDLRVGSLAFDRFGRLWAATWPDRSQVVRFTDKRRAELTLKFAQPIDSIAFGPARSGRADPQLSGHPPVRRC